MTDTASYRHGRRLMSRAGTILVVLAALATAVLGQSPARTPLRVRVLTYNIHHAEGVDKMLDLDRIARVIRSAEPDLVALQEVDRRATRTKSVDQPAELSRLTGLAVTFGPNIPLQGGDYGNAVLSRWPIARSVNHRLPNVDAGEQRGVLEVHVTASGFAEPIVLWATHFDHRGNDAERRASAAAIEALVGQQPAVPTLLAGDLNDVPASPTLTALSVQWTRSNPAVIPTIPAAKPSRQIDYVLFRPVDRWRAVETRVLDEAVASDHRPVLAVLDLMPAGTSRRTLEP
jgi:endonuclease/exonuclease/phosphatase family metal-dependent hydrolase